MAVSGGLDHAALATQQGLGQKSADRIVLDQQDPQALEGDGRNAVVVLTAPDGDGQSLPSACCGQHPLGQGGAAQRLDQIAVESRRPVSVDQITLAGLEQDDGLALRGPHHQGSVLGHGVVDQGHARLTRDAAARGLDLGRRRLTHEGIGGAHRHDHAVQRTGARRGVGDGEVGFEPETGAGTVGPIAHGDRAAHGLGQTAHHGQTQTRPVEAGGVRGVGVAELVKDAHPRLFRDAGAGVVDNEGQTRAGDGSAGAFDRQADPAPVGEFHGVARQIEQDLT
ncbi:hypothetical protein D3C85_955780 [compost metagenome]